jgi:hypothetical protein
MKWLVPLLLATLPVSAAHAIEPTTCSEAYRACVKPDFGHCDAGCAATCKLRLDGCMKTRSFATPRGLMRNLKQR